MVYEVAERTELRSSLAWQMDVANIRISSRT